MRVDKKEHYLSWLVKREFHQRSLFTFSVVFKQAHKKMDLAIPFLYILFASKICI